MAQHKLRGFLKYTLLMADLNKNAKIALIVSLNHQLWLIILLFLPVQILYQNGYCAILSENDQVRLPLLQLKGTL